MGAGLGDATTQVHLWKKKITVFFLDNLESGMSIKGLGYPDPWTMELEMKVSKRAQNNFLSDFAHFPRTSAGEESPALFKKRIN